MLLAVLATTLGVTVCSKRFADSIARDETLERLSSTAKLCVNAPYPLTDSVLTQIQELSAFTLGVAEVMDLRLQSFEWSPSRAIFRSPKIANGFSVLLGTALLKIRILSKPSNSKVVFVPMPKHFVCHKKNKQTASPGI